MLDVPRELVAYLASLLAAERRALGTLPTKVNSIGGRLFNSTTVNRHVAI